MVVRPPSRGAGSANQGTHCIMTLTLAQLEEARRALDAPLFGNMAGDAHVSFEFFPPKSAKMDETIWSSIQTLAPLKPRFVSVPYGAGGSTRERRSEERRVGKECVSTGSCRGAPNNKK